MRHWHFILCIALAIKAACMHPGTKDAPPDPRLPVYVAKNLGIENPTPPDPDPDPDPGPERVEPAAPRRIIVQLAPVGDPRALVSDEIPHEQPPLGITFDADYVRARDPDTIEVRPAGMNIVIALRLIRTWAPELHSQDAEERSKSANGREWVNARLTDKKLRVFVPFSGVGEQPLKSLTFDRVPSWVYVKGMQPDNITFNQMVVMNGFASSKKGGKLGE